MTRIFTPKVVTANDLLEGDVVYLAEGGGWTRSLRQALLLEDETAAKFCLERAGQDRGAIVDPYLADVVPDARSRPQPGHRREALRAQGPTNYRHGKQAKD